MVDFPTGLPDAPNGVAGNPLSTMHTSESHVTATNRMIANILALATKLGYGSSSPGASQAVLRRTATGQSGWAQVAAGDYAAGSIANADVNAAANIAYSKLNLANSVAATDIVANAISQVGYVEGSTVDPTTTTSSWADLPNMSVTLTTRGGILLAWLSCRFSHSNANNHGGITLDLDGSQVGKAERTAAASAAGGQFTITTQHRWTGVSAGSHTVKGRWYSSTGTLTAVSDARSLLVVELVR